MIRESNNNYISLQEATEYCSYTQEYLSLRARQGKLKAVKIGRNWITKKEWVKEYIERMKEYNNNLKEKKLAEQPENLPVEEKPSVRITSQQTVPKIRFGFSFALVLALLITGIAFGKESFKSIFNDLDPYVKEINQAGDIIVENTAEVLSETVSDIPHSFANVSGTIDNTYNKIALNLLSMSRGLAQVASPDVLKSTLNTFKEYGQWVSEEISIVRDRISIIGQKMVKGIKEIRKIPQIVTELFKERVVIQREISELEAELKALKEEGLPVKEIIKEIEVSRITKIEPIKEIIKEIKTLDDQSLKRIRTILSQQETKVEKLRLAARLGYINFPPSLSPSGAVSVTTLGTITAGTWQGTAIATQYGGTGADLSARPQGGVLYMGGSTIMGVSAAGTSGNALISGGTGVPTWTNTPSWSTIILSTSVTSPLYTGTGAVEVSSAGGAALTLDSDSGILTLGAGTNTIQNTDAATALTINPTGSLDIDTSTIDLTTQATNFDLKDNTVNTLSLETNLLSLDTQNSRVGIGTSNPQAKLDIYEGSINIGGIGPRALISNDISGAQDAVQGIQGNRAVFVGTMSSTDPSDMLMGSYDWSGGNFWGMRRIDPYYGEIGLSWDWDTDYYSMFETGGTGIGMRDGWVSIYVYGCLSAKFYNGSYLGLYDCWGTGERTIMLDPSSEDSYINSTGKFGLGTAFGTGAPADKLTVAGGDFTLYDPSSLGSEKVTNGNFSTVPDTAWTWGSCWNHDTVNLEADYTANYNSYLSQNVNVVAGQIYQVVFTVKNRTYGWVKPTIGGVSGASVSSNTTSTQYIRATSTGNLQFGVGATYYEGEWIYFDGSIDDVSVKLITGGDIKLSGKLGIGTTNPTYPLHIYAGGVERYRFGTDGTAYADVAWTTFSPYISMHFIEGEKEDYEIGELVVISENKKVSKSSEPYQNTLIGVVAEKAGFISYPHDWKEEMKENNLALDEFPGIPVAYLGDVSVKASLEGGEIAVGDPLTSSSQEGVAMKATEPGRVIGLALEPFDGTITQYTTTEIIENEETGESETIEECETIESEIGKIMVFVNPHWSLGSLTGDDSLAESDNSEQIMDESESASTDDSVDKPTILDQFTLAIKKSLEKLGLLIKNGIAKVKELIAEKITARKLCLEGDDGETICVDKNQLEELLMKNQIQNINISNNSSSSGGNDSSIGDIGGPTGGSDDGLEGEKPLDCDLTHLNLCSVETECLNTGGYWYNESCNAEPQKPSPESEELAEQPAEESELEEPTEEAPSIDSDQTTEEEIAEPEPEPTPTLTPETISISTTPTPEPTPTEKPAAVQLPSPAEQLTE